MTKLHRGDYQWWLAYGGHPVRRVDADPNGKGILNGRLVGYGLSCQPLPT